MGSIRTDSQDWKRGLKESTIIPIFRHSIETGWMERSGTDGMWKWNPVEKISLI